MCFRCLLLLLVLSGLILKSQPVSMPRDASRIDVSLKEHLYTKIISIKKNNITINLETINVIPDLRENSVDYGLGFITRESSSHTREAAKIHHLMVKWNDQKVLIPNTAYNQLLDIKYIYVVAIKDKVMVRIMGGDAGSSYFCDLYFNNRHLLSKEVYFGEFPEDANEMTKYKYNESTN